MRHTGHVIAATSLVALATCTGFGHVQARTPVKCAPASRLKAVDLARKAKTSLEARNFQRALDDLLASYNLCPDPSLRHAIGRVHEEAGRPVEALASFRACVEEGADGDILDECKARVASLTGRLGRGWLVVECDTPGAKVFLDEDKRPNPPGRFEVTAGPHSVMVEAAGCEPFLAPVTVTGAGETRLVARLARGRDTATTAGSRPARSSVWNWVGIGAGAAMIAGSAGFFVRYALDRRDARPASPSWSGDSVSPANAIAGGLMAGVGVAAIVTSVVLWPRTEATVFPAKDRRGISVLVRF